MVDRLEAAGLVERRLDPADRRVKRLHLTPAAAPVLEQMRMVGSITREEALTGIAPIERERMIEALTTMKTNLLGLEMPCDPFEPDPEAVPDPGDEDDRAADDRAADDRNDDDRDDGDRDGGAGDARR